jgi:hypothetical protein
MKKSPALVVAAAVLLLFSACSSTPDAGDSDRDSLSTSRPSPSSSAGSTSAAGSTPITITIGGTAIEASLNNSAAAQDFVDAMPVTVASIRNSDIEYFGAVASPLTEEDGDYPEVGPGDIVYYAPKDEVALIFEETSSPGQLTKIGDITSDLSIFDGLPDSADILYELG